MISQRLRIYKTTVASALFCVLSLSLSSCSSSNNSPEAQLVDDEVSIDLVEQSLIESLGDNPGGLSALVRIDGETRRAVAGTRDAQGNPLTQESVFHVGSVSKTFVATMLMQLVEEQQVELDSPLSNYLPEATVGSDATVRELLSHRAGVANYTDVPAFFNVTLTDRSREFQPSELLDYVQGTTRNTSGDFVYSNTHYILLGQLIERLDGGSLQGSLERRITAPLELDATRFVITDEQRPSALVLAWSPGVSEGNFVSSYTSISSGAWAAGSLVSNVQDLEVFMDALLGGQLVQSATLAQMLEVGSDSYGLGLIEFPREAQQSTFGHGGSIPGYLSMMAMTSDRKSGLIVLTNNDSLNTEAVLQNLLAVEFTESSD